MDLPNRRVPCRRVARRRVKGSPVCMAKRQARLNTGLRGPAEHGSVVRITTHWVSAREVDVGIARGHSDGRQQDLMTIEGCGLCLQESKQTANPYLVRAGGLTSSINAEEAFRTVQPSSGKS